MAESTHLNFILSAAFATSQFFNQRLYTADSVEVFSFKMELFSFGTHTIKINETFSIARLSLMYKNIFSQKQSRTNNGRNYGSVKL